MKTRNQSLLTLLAVLLSLAILLTACGSGALSKEHPRQTIGDKTFTFASEKDKDAWRKPLERLLSNAREVGAEDYDEPTYKDLPTFWNGRDCALFDVTLDGVPELIVNYGGGSAGNHFYEIFDLYTGASVGTFDGDAHDDWRVYYNTELDLICLMGVYGFREGWDINYTYHSQLTFDAERGEYTSRVLYETKSVIQNMNDDAPYVIYYVGDQKVSEADYAAAMAAFERTYIELDGTKLTFFSWYDLEAEEGNYKERAQEMTDALLSSEQKFPLPEENT